ncbi:MAG TPA: MFS transporter [Bacillales bacterium]|nr:MFS transporter [Bacillales bacterium]
MQRQPASFQSSKTVYPILFVIAVVHLLNDAISALIPAMFPILEESLSLSFTQLGFIAFAANMTSSVMQPVVGLYTDRRPAPFALPLGLCFTFFGIVGLAVSPSFWLIILSVIFVGSGSAVFHPEGSRVAYMASGGRRGFAQSIYQVGGNAGQSLGPIITAILLVPLGQGGAVWFTIAAALAVILLIYIAKWYSTNLQTKPKARKKSKKTKSHRNVRQRRALFGLGLLTFLVFARSWYRAAITNFYTFFTIHHYHFTIQRAEIYIFLFLAFAALGTFIGGPIADKIGKRNVIFLSMAGATPFSLLLPHVGPVLALPILMLTGLVLIANTSVSVVYAQELLPGKIGTASGLIVGLGFGMGAIGSIVIGRLADTIGIGSTMVGVSFLPLIGLLALLLPKDEELEDE